MSYKQLLTKIDQSLKANEQVVVTIDGMSAAGKSSLAALLKEAYGCYVISLDSFFLRSEQRTPERLAKPGGNIDYERFLEEVLMPLRAGAPFAYRPFDCSVMDFSDPIYVDKHPLTILEGVYSMHPYFAQSCNSNAVNDISVFLKIDEATQHDRLIKRNPALFDRFINEWIPMENTYFEHFNVAEKCNFVLTRKQNSNKTLA